VIIFEAVLISDLGDWLLSELFELCATFDLPLLKEVVTEEMERRRLLQ
jgi:hypothetical protein